MGFVQRQAPPRRVRRLARTDVQLVLGCGLLPDAPASHSSTLTSMTVGHAATIVRAHPDGPTVAGDPFRSSRCPGQRSSAGVGFAILCASARSHT